MTALIDRRGFVAAMPALGVLALGIDPSRARGATPSERGESLRGEFPRQDVALVRQVVGASHRDLAKVTELVEKHPALANAWWDWGFGDWESPLGAAAHTGRRPIAEFLISRGARVDIFAAAMLGWVDVVKGFVEASPGVQRTLGPHCITLMAHARNGGDEAKSVVEYLTSVGGADEGPKIEQLTSEAREGYAGTFSYGADEADRFVVRAGKDRLEFVKGESIVLRLHHVGNHEFFPAGVPSVRFRFAMNGGAAGAVTIVDHEPVLTAKRAV